MLGGEGRRLLSTVYPPIESVRTSCHNLFSTIVLTFVHLVVNSRYTDYTAFVHYYWPAQT